MFLPSQRPLEAIVRCDGHLLSRTLVRRGRYVLGQDRRNEIVLDQDSISSRHARLTVVSETEIYVEDCGSANGTLVDGKPANGVTPVTLDSRIELGQCVLLFQRTGLPAIVFSHLPDGFLRAFPHKLGEVVVEGHSSSIIEAHDSSLGRDIALKIMRPESQSRTSEVLQFIREAQITSQLQHPSIPPIYEMALNERKQLFYTTRFMSGATLPRVLEGLARADEFTLQRFSLSKLISVFQKICDGVAFAHEHGVIHCTLRPENVTVGEHGEVFVTGWTFATILPPPEVQNGSAPVQRVEAPPSQESPPLSPFSAAVQVKGGSEGIDQSVDIHALGGILFKILTLHDPVTGTDEAQLLARILSGHVAVPASLARNPRPHWPGRTLPDYLIGVALKALSPNDAERPATVLELQERIAAWQEDHTIGQKK